jgi:hypothetical protein
MKSPILRSLLASLFALGILPFNAQADTIHVPPVVITGLHHVAYNRDWHPSPSRQFQDAVTFSSGPGEFSGPGFSASIGTGDTVVTRVQAPTGSHFQVYHHPDAEGQVFYLNAYWQAGGDMTSQVSPPNISFQNLVGTPPSITYEGVSFSNSGNVVRVQIQATVTGDFSFCAIEISFEVQHAVSKTLRTYGSVNSSSVPSFGVSAWGSTDLEVRTVMAILPNPPIRVPPVVIAELHHSFFDDAWDNFPSRYIRDAVTFPSGPGEFSGPGFSESIGTADRVVTRFEAPTGSRFEIHRHPDAESQGLHLNAYWQAGGDMTSNVCTPLITFENFVGTPPTITHKRASFSDSGNVVSVELEATVTGDFSFSAIEFSFEVQHTVSKQRRTYASVSSSSVPSFSVWARGPLDLEVRPVMAIEPRPSGIAGTIEIHRALELVITELDPARNYLLQSSEDLEAWEDEEIIVGTQEEISRFRPTRHDPKRFWRLMEVETNWVN